ncbi:MAG TPA: dihydropteroate synthase [Planctomycetota bacterium]|nr:dihydropteroate synthase [Planctomycetota bacterium]
MKRDSRPLTIQLPHGRSLTFGRRTLIIGIVNVTPDSFSDGGWFLHPHNALDHIEIMVHAGVDIIDIGGESTRPGAEAVSVDEELHRVIPLIELLAERTDVPVSIDTTKPEVARAALAAGASIVNDITGLHGDEAMARAAAEFGAAVIVMHIKGTPRTMQQNPVYDDLLGEVIAYLRESIAIAERNGVPAERVIVDPGIGFGKTVRHNLELMARLRELEVLGRPILVGTSRKSTIGKITGKPADERQFGTAATVAICIANGAGIVRVHDVPEMADVVKMADAICGYTQY